MRSSIFKQMLLTLVLAASIYGSTAHGRVGEPTFIACPLTVLYTLQVPQGWLSGFNGQVNLPFKGSQIATGTLYCHYEIRTASRVESVTLVRNVPSGMRCSTDHSLSPTFKCEPNTPPIKKKS